MAVLSAGLVGAEDAEVVDTEVDVAVVDTEVDEVAVDTEVDEVVVVGTEVDEVVVVVDTVAMTTEKVEAMAAIAVVEAMAEEVKIDEAMGVVITRAVNKMMAGNLRSLFDQDGIVDRVVHEGCYIELLLPLKLDAFEDDGLLISPVQ